MLYRPLARSLIWFTIGLRPSPPRRRKLCLHSSAPRKLLDESPTLQPNVPPPSEERRIYRPCAVSEGVQANLAARSSRFYASSDPRGEKDQRNEGEELLRENIFLFPQRIIVIIEIATSSKISSLRMIYRLKGIKWQEIDARFWNNCSFLLRKRKRG